LCFEAVNRIINPEPVDGQTMFIVAVLGVIVNLGMMKVLSQGGNDHGHSHDAIALFKEMVWGSQGKGHHGHAHDNHAHETTSPLNALKEHASTGNDHGHAHSSHGHNDDHGHAHATHDSHGEHKDDHDHCAHHGNSNHSEENINVRAAFIHALGDLVQSVGVVIAAIIIWIAPSARIADPICTFLFSILVLFTTWDILKSAFHSLLNSVPSGIDLANIAGELSAIPGVSNVHDLHVWGYGTGLVAMTVHVVADDAVAALKSAQQIGKKFGIAHSTVQIERCGSVDVANCYLFNEHIGACALTFDTTTLKNTSSNAIVPTPPKGLIIDRPHPHSRHDNSNGCNNKIVNELEGTQSVSLRNNATSPKSSHAHEHGHSHAHDEHGHSHAHGSHAHGAHAHGENLDVHVSVAPVATSPTAHGHGHSHSSSGTPVATSPTAHGHGHSHSSSGTPVATSPTGHGHSHSSSSHGHSHH
jgi:cation diffusion facilitator family transporter